MKRKLIALALALSLGAFAAEQSTETQAGAEGEQAGWTCSACQTDFNSCHQSYGVNRSSAARYAMQSCQMFGDCYLDRCWRN